MVNSGREEREYMATGRERSKSLHNFSLPPLKWGTQRRMRCIKAESPCNSGAGNSGVEYRVRRRSPSLKIGNSSSPIAVHDFNSNPSSAAPSRSEEIHELSENLLSDLRTYAEKMKESIFKEESLFHDDGEEETVKEKERRVKKRKQVESPQPASAPAESAIPWNLRNRKQTTGSPVIGASNGIGAGNARGLRIEEKSVDSSPPKKDLARPKFSVPLSKMEIEEDFKMLLGHRPPRRPKKHPRAVQKQLEHLFPGSYLTEVTPDLYKVSETADKKKR